MTTTKQLLRGLGGWCKKILLLREQLYEEKITIEKFVEETESIAGVISGTVRGLKKNIKRGDKKV